MKIIELTQGYFALIDDEDYLLVSSYGWHACKASTGQTIRVRTNVFIQGKRTAREMSWFIKGQAPSGMMIDHINGDALDNRKCNLRFVSRAQNSMNSPAQFSRKHSSFKGVGKYQKPGRKHWKWVARIVSKTLGINIAKYCESEIEAARTYDQLAKHYFGEFARLNFP